jgi:hypothetical protein
MSKHNVSKFTDFDIASNGRSVVLNFEIDSGPISLEFNEILLEKVHYELGLAITKARQLSEISKQHLVSFLRPPQFRADLIENGQTVIISFRQANGLEMNYGLEPTHADALARQILSASERGKLAKRPTPN